AGQRDWQRGPRKIMETIVKRKTSTACGVIATAGVLSLGIAGTAGAAQLGHKPKPAPQGSGVRLPSALLPTSTFGGGVPGLQHPKNGNGLWSSNARIKPSSLSCANFEQYIFVGGYGNTAGATDTVLNTSPAWSNYPNLEIGADQTVLQFKTAQAASSFYN